jgi:hypothetical protein
MQQIGQMLEKKQNIYHYEYKDLWEVEKNIGEEAISSA